MTINYSKLTVIHYKSLRSTFDRSLIFVKNDTKMHRRPRIPSKFLLCQSATRQVPANKEQNNLTNQPTSISQHYRWSGLLCQSEGMCQTKNHKKPQLFHIIVKCAVMTPKMTVLSGFISCVGKEFGYFRLICSADTRIIPRIISRIISPLPSTGLIYFRGRFRGPNKQSRQKR